MDCRSYVCLTKNNWFICNWDWHILSHFILSFVNRPGKSSLLFSPFPFFMFTFSSFHFFHLSLTKCCPDSGSADCSRRLWFPSADWEFIPWGSNIGHSNHEGTILKREYKGEEFEFLRIYNVQSLLLKVAPIISENISPVGISYIRPFLAFHRMSYEKKPWPSARQLQSVNVINQILLRKKEWLS